MTENCFFRYKFSKSPEKNTRAPALPASNLSPAYRISIANHTKKHSDRGD